MPKRQRRKFSPQEKLKILRLHLLEQQPISSLCEQFGLHPTLFYQWQRTFFENGEAAFSSPRTETRHTEKKIEALQAKLRHKDEVLAAVVEEMVRLKKELGESWP